MSTETETRILKGKPIAAAMKRDVAAGVERLLAQGGRQPKLVAILVGEDPASQTYVASKARSCEEVGMAGEVLNLPDSTDRQTLLGHIRRFNEDDAVDGILVQLPLPAQLKAHEREVLEEVSAQKDVDGFHPENVGRMWLDQPALTPATPTGIIELLRREGFELKGKHAVIVGRSAIVGKPMAALLLRENCTVTVCHSRTHDLPAVCRQADLLIAAVGRPAMVGAEHVRRGAVVIDVGINRIDDRAQVERLFPGNEKRLAGLEKRGSTLVGDVDYTQVKPLASAITPVPGGVGLLTVAQLLENTLRASCWRQGIEI